MTAARLAALRALLDQHRLDAVLISRSANKRYYSGLRLGADEEASWPGTLFVSRQAAIILADSRYTEQAEREAPGWKVVTTTGPMQEDLPAILAEHDIVSLGMEAAIVSHAEWSALAGAAPGVELHAIDDELVPLRLVKSAEEIDAIGRACALTDACYEHLVGFVGRGMTERQVAWELESWFRANGAENPAFAPIVLAGARAAMPHGQPSDATIETGNVLLIDFGCAVDGYRSDMTRTLFIGEVPDEVRRAHDAVREAQAAAFEAIVVGINGQEVDAVARRCIDKAGFPAYQHGLGHGIGLETHEPPSLRASRPYTLDAGMVFSVEPGIYLPGVTGIRIEDIVVLEANGPRFLTVSPRQALVIDS
ncbi:MAG: Xaa-Pro peptidase family protein [Chloroflexota bacterium]|nr:Xaa-Pro peptidase family protein [Chloroflexota bacterium]